MLEVLEDDVGPGARRFAAVMAAVESQQGHRLAGEDERGAGFDRLLGRRERLLGGVDHRFLEPDHVPRRFLWLYRRRLVVPHHRHGEVGGAFVTHLRELIEVLADVDVYRFVKRWVFARLGSHRQADGLAVLERFIDVSGEFVVRGAFDRRSERVVAHGILH